MGLLSKKICSLCGSEIGLFGNHGVADGNICKNCWKKLSPYFRKSRDTRVKDIEEHINYRNDNETELFNFNPTLVLGDKTKVFIDEKNKSFVINNNDDYRKGNPDIIKLDQVMAVDLEIDEDKDEIYDKDEEGKEISFDPKRYEYEYSFFLDIKVNSPYFEHIKFDINNFDHPDSKNSELYFKQKYIAQQIQHALKPSLYPEAILEKVNEEEKEEWTCPECKHINNTKFCGNCGKAKPSPRWFCPDCGKENTGKFCIGCGTKRPDNI